jgi:transposase
MYIATIPNRRSPPAILLRESFREGRKVKNRTLANLTQWPPAQVELFRRVLRGETLVAPSEAFEIVRTRPHGHVAAVLGTMRRLELPALLGPAGRERDLVESMIAARILDPRSKLATAESLRSETLHSTLGEILGVAQADEDELYEAMDWLLERQAPIEKALAKRHLHDGTLVLYDVSSTYFEGRRCPLARLGHPRDGKKGKLQIVFGLLCDGEGRPVAVEVFEGNTGDPKTLGPQLTKLRQQFELRRVVLVGDRGMITDARIRKELQPVEGLDWITALRAPAIQRLVDEGTLQPSLFDEKDLAEITGPSYPGERLIVCKNPLLAQERARKREDLLQATERELAKVRAATQRKRNRLHGQRAIALRVGALLGRFKMGKHFQLVIRDDGFDYRRKEESIRREAALDGFYVIRTTVTTDRLAANDVVRTYKRLATVERAFRSTKTVDLRVRPIYHHQADRVRAHVLICMLAYYVEWHLRQALAPMLFDDDDKAAAEAARRSAVAPAERSERALRKAADKRTEDGLPVHSFQTLLKDLATVAKNRVRPTAEGLPDFDMITTPTPVQKRAFDLLGVSWRM